MNEDTRSDEQSNAPTATNDGDSEGALSRRSFLRTSATATAGALALGAGTSPAAALQEDCSSFGTFSVGGGDFQLINNDWGSSDVNMCIWKENDGTYGYQWDKRSSGGDPNYPQALLGTKPWGSDTGVEHFPIERGNIDQFEMEVDIDQNISGGHNSAGWDLAEEWWLMDGQPSSDNPPHTHEIMMVLDWGGGHGHNMQERNVWTDKFGNQIDYWAHYGGGGGTSADFHIFRVRGGMTSGKVDLKAIIDFMNERWGTRDDLLVSGVELGNEYWQGTQGDVTFNQFDVTINGTTYTSGSGSSDTNTPTDTPTPTETTEPPSDAPGSDLNGDGLNEDLNGNGRLDSDDVVTLFKDKDDESITNNVDKFDFNRNGRIDYDDITELFKQL